MRASFGAIAQLGERNTGSVEVSGSIPLSSTKKFDLAIAGLVVFEVRPQAVSDGWPPRSSRLAPPNTKKA
jgi:hypothetical protein